MNEALAHSVEEACISKVPQPWKLPLRVIPVRLRHDVGDSTPSETMELRNLGAFPHQMLDSVHLQTGG